MILEVPTPTEAGFDRARDESGMAPARLRRRHTREKRQDRDRDRYTRPHDVGTGLPSASSR